VAEVKQVERGKKFYYSSGSFEKQWRNLLSAKNNKTFYKHPDTGWGTPWDLTIYVKTPAYFIIFFDKTFYVIDGELIIEYSSCLDRSNWENMININIKLLSKGESFTIEPFTAHRFYSGSKSSCDFIEISTHHNDNDSFRLIESV